MTLAIQLTEMRNGGMSRKPNSGKLYPSDSAVELDFCPRGRVANFGSHPSPHVNLQPPILPQQLPMFRLLCVRSWLFGCTQMPLAWRVRKTLTVILGRPYKQFYFGSGTFSGCESSGGTVICLLGYQRHHQSSR